MRRLALVATAFAACTPEAPPPAAPSNLSVGTLLGTGDSTGFERATVPRPFVFPADHGPHPGFRSEWWYVTGVLRTRAAPARRFGYQLTFFRQALTPQANARASHFAAREIHMAHLAISDIDGQRFLPHERFARAALALAGARATPFAVWNGAWRLASQGTDFFPLHAQARAPARDGVAAAAIDLALEDGKPPVLQGDRGLSAKGPEPGNASHYYSLVRLPTRGSLTVGEQRFEVEGLSWLDREWSTSALGPDNAGWDWLALHLGDGRELMVYRLRRKDGSAAPESRATLIDAAGAPRVFAPPDLSVQTTGVWTSPTGARYPGRLDAAIKSIDLAITALPSQLNQELPLSVRYWEGVVDATGHQGATALAGDGYLELVGY